MSRGAADAAVVTAAARLEDPRAGGEGPRLVRVTAGLMDSTRLVPSLAPIVILNLCFSFSLVSFFIPHICFVSLPSLISCRPNT